MPSVAYRPASSISALVTFWDGLIASLPWALYSGKRTDTSSSSLFSLILSTVSTALVLFLLNNPIPSRGYSITMGKQRTLKTSGPISAKI